jgi:hypothetical protein
MLGPLRRGLLLGTNRNGTGNQARLRGGELQTNCKRLLLKINTRLQ